MVGGETWLIILKTGIPFTEYTNIYKYTYIYIYIARPIKVTSREIQSCLVHKSVFVLMKFLLCEVYM